jgi:hypothetical protein
MIHCRYLIYLSRCGGDQVRTGVHYKIKTKKQVHAKAQRRRKARQGLKCVIGFICSVPVRKEPKPDYDLTT